MLYHQTTTNQTKINVLKTKPCYKFELIRPSKVSSQCCTQAYFDTDESLWAPKKWAQIFKKFTDFFNSN